MALEKEVIQDKIEIVSKWKFVQVRTATVITEDGIEISKSYNRHSLTCLDDISQESAEVQAVCNSVWTEQLKIDYQNYLDASITGV